MHIGVNILPKVVTTFHNHKIYKNRILVMCISGLDMEQLEWLCCVLAGPGLVFIVYAEGIAQLPVSPLWSILFMLMLINVGIGSQVSYIRLSCSRHCGAFERSFCINRMQTLHSWCKRRRCTCFQEMPSQTTGCLSWWPCRCDSKARVKDWRTHHSAAFVWRIGHIPLTRTALRQRH